MAKIDTGKIAVYKGKYPLNVATKDGKPFTKEPGEELTAAEVAAIPDKTFRSMQIAGDVLVADKPKASAKPAGQKEDDK